MQTVPSSSGSNQGFYSGLNYSMSNKEVYGDKGTLRPGMKWSKHSLAFPFPNLKSPEDKGITNAPVRRSRASKFANKNLKMAHAERPSVSSESKQANAASEMPKVRAANQALANAESNTKNVSSAKTENATKKPAKRRVLRPRMALITLSPNALKHLKGLLNQPEPKMIRIGVQNRGCSGLTYHLEYVDKPGKFDEVVEQDGVKVIIDSKALFSIVGSEMDWLDDKLSSRFIFKNPNSKGTCGCGESFMV